MPFALRRLVWLCSVLFLVASARAQTTFSSVVVFGDSLSDTGNIAHLVQSATGGAVRYPSDIPALKFDYTDGRFTDGTDTQPAAQAYLGVWIEQLATSFAAKPAVKDSLDGGTNYAYGDATTASTTTTVTEGPISIAVRNMGLQVSDYLATNPTPNAGTLYVLWGGSNDVLQAAETGQDPMAAASTAAANEIALIQRLMAAGATNFLVPNIPPLGATPEGIASGSGTALNNASAAFAAQLTIGLNTLKQGAMGKTLNLYQPDILTRFATVAANPMSVGLGNVSSAAQNITGSPDPYLIWDGLHPTTTGHHFAAATAANLLTALVSSATTITAPATVLASQSVTVTAKVTSTASTATPTGLVTLFAATTAIASGTLNSSGVAMMTVPANTVVPGIYNIVGVYAGDTTFNVSASAGQPGLVIANSVATTTVLTSSNATPNSGASVTFTATVTPTVSTYGPATGTVTFLNGTTTLGTGTLSNGVATYTTATLPTGAQTITASYPAQSVFGASTSAAVTETVATPSFTATASPTSLTIASGSSGTTTLTAASMGGYAGALTLSCGTLPAHLSCAFSTTTLTLASTGAANPTSTLTIATNAAVTSAALARPARPGAWSAPRIFSATLLGPGLASMLLLTLRRRRGSLHGLRLGVVLLLLLSAGAAVGLAGCGSSNSSSNAAPGTYMVPVSFTPATGTAQVVNISVTVQ